MTTIPAYVDEAGARGLARDLKPERDSEYGILCALVFEPVAHDKALADLAPVFQRFVDAAPQGAKHHITDAFLPGNEKWREVAEQVRTEYVAVLKKRQPKIVYAARRLATVRARHEQHEALKQQAQAGRQSNIVITGANRPSDDRVEDELITSLCLTLDGFGELCEQVCDSPEIDLLFDATDIADRYTAALERTRTVSGNTTTVKGWDPATKSKVERTITSEASAPFRLDTHYLGKIDVVGKEHPLVLAVDIVANYLSYHFRDLAPDAPLNASSSIAGWELEELVWGVHDGHMDDLI